MKLITPHYQHVDGTSFAAPLVASTIACMLEANPELSPLLARSILLETAHSVLGADQARQGAGAVAPAEAVARALAANGKVVFSVQDHAASHVEVLGSWNGWNRSGLVAEAVETGFWRTQPANLPKGRHSYKFLLDGHRWLDDPANPKKGPDGLGGLNSVIDVTA